LQNIYDVVSNVSTIQGSSLENMGLAIESKT